MQALSHVQWETSLLVFGRSLLLEAMALGRPVTLTHVGGAPGFCSDGAALSRCHRATTPKALHLAFPRLLENGELRDRLGHEAAKTPGRYVSVVAPSYLAYFEDLMAGE